MLRVSYIIDCIKQNGYVRDTTHPLLFLAEVLSGAVSGERCLLSNTSFKNGIPAVVGSFAWFGFSQSGKLFLNHSLYLKLQK